MNTLIRVDEQEIDDALSDAVSNGEGRLEADYFVKALADRGLKIVRVGSDAALTDRNRALLEALEHISEYWNRNANERAMLDALEHIGEVCTAALHPTQPKEPNDG